LAPDSISQALFRWGVRYANEAADRPSNGHRYIRHFDVRLAHNSEAAASQREAAVSNTLGDLLTALNLSPKEARAPRENQQQLQQQPTPANTVASVLSAINAWRLGIFRQEKWERMGRSLL
jgi:hypothetical protein